LEQAEKKRTFRQDKRILRNKRGSILGGCPSSEIPPYLCNANEMKIIHEKANMAKLPLLAKRGVQRRC